MAINRKKHTSYLRSKDVYKSPGAARKAAARLGLKGIHSHGRGDAKRFMPGSTHQAYERAKKKKKRS